MNNFRNQSSDKVSRFILQLTKRTALNNLRIGIYLMFGIFVSGCGPVTDEVDCNSFSVDIPQGACVNIDTLLSQYCPEAYPTGATRSTDITDPLELFHYYFRWHRFVFLEEPAGVITYVNDSDIVPETDFAKTALCAPASTPIGSQVTNYEERSHWETTSRVVRERLGGNQATLNIVPSTTPTPEADLEVSQVVTSIEYLDTANFISYELTVQNNGPDPVEGVWLSDLISSAPKPYLASNPSASSGICSTAFTQLGFRFNCQLDVLPAGASATVIIDRIGIPSDAQTVHNEVDIQATFTHDFLGLSVDDPQENNHSEIDTNFYDDY